MAPMQPTPKTTAKRPLHVDRSRTLFMFPASSNRRAFESARAESTKSPRIGGALSRPPMRVAESTQQWAAGPSSQSARRWLNGLDAEGRRQSCYVRNDASFGFDSGGALTDLARVLRNRIPDRNIWVVYA